MPLVWFQAHALGAVRLQPRRRMFVNARLPFVRIAPKVQDLFWELGDAGIELLDACEFAVMEDGKTFSVQAFHATTPLAELGVVLGSPKVVLFTLKGGDIGALTRDEISAAAAANDDDEEEEEEAGECGGAGLIDLDDALKELADATPSKHEASEEEAVEDKAEEPADGEEEEGEEEGGLGASAISGEIVIEGGLVLLSGKKGLIKPKARHFRLTAKTLAWYESHTGFALVGALSLSDVEYTNKPSAKCGKKKRLLGAFDVVTGERVYTLHASTPEESAAWYEAIRTATRTRRNTIVPRRCRTRSLRTVLAAADARSGEDVLVVGVVAKTLHGYTAYDIDIGVPGSVFSTRARYSQLLKFHMALQESGVQLPPFPPKKVRHRNSKFIERRCKDLQVYIRDLCVCEGARRMEWWKDFAFCL